jgi:ATP-binding protein involved in chromosome partitioning
VKHIIAVGAGKGGVGKSTVSTNLAVALSRLGKSVGLLDADIYGPSIPKMLGLEKEKPMINTNNRILPIERHGVKSMSMGFMVDDKSALVWRGPMLFKAMDQFLKDVMWEGTDYLVVDLPPGTGDVQLSLVQKVKVSGTVIVSTPQDVALIDVKRCVDMFKRTGTPILGLVENMAHFTCPHCHSDSNLFSRGHLVEFCETSKIRMLGSIPFNPAINAQCEKGSPMVEAFPDAAESDIFMGIARRIAEELPIV